jgi:hypothetical protein
VATVVPAEGVILQRVLEAAHPISPEGLSREAYAKFGAALMKTACGRHHRRRFALVMPPNSRVGSGSSGPGILGMMTMAINTIAAPTMNSIFSRYGARSRHPQTVANSPVLRCSQIAQRGSKAPTSTAAQPWSEGLLESLCGVRVHSGTAPFSDGPYSCNMQLESIKAAVATVWVSAVCTTGVTVNVTSLSGWTLLAGLAVLPPLVMMWHWLNPRQTMSQSIQESLQ